MSDNQSLEPNPPRALWMRFETIHAVTYFGAESAEAAKAIGLDSWCKGYFAFRAAPLGLCTPGVLDAAFHSFSLPFVRRWVPAIWDATTPAIALATRSAAAAATLRRVATDAELELNAFAEQAKALLEPVIPNCQWSGRPVFAANRDVALPIDPVEGLWQLCTLLREHRGDGHVIACTAAGISGLQAHVLIAIEQSNSFDDLSRTRGWTTDQWNVALEGLRHQGLVTIQNRENPEYPESHETGKNHENLKGFMAADIKSQMVLTDRGRAIRAEIESTTDTLAAAPFQELAAQTTKTAGASANTCLAKLTHALDPLARAVAASGTIRYPNPMGLPAINLKA